MRKFAIALAACAAVGLAMPLSTSGASAEGAVVVIQPDRVRDGDHDRGMHHGWRHHEKVVIVKHRRHRDRDND